MDGWTDRWDEARGMFSTSFINPVMASVHFICPYIHAVYPSIHQIIYSLIHVVHPCPPFFMKNLNCLTQICLSSIYPSKNANIYHANPSIRSFIQPSIHHAVTVHPVIYPFIQMSIHPVIYPDIYPSVIYPSIHHPVIIHPLICSSVLSFMHSLKSHLHRCSPNISFWLRISPDWPECPSIDPSKHRSNHLLLFSLSSILLSV